MWALVEKGEVALGMTAAMAALACGPELESVGNVVSGNTVSPIYECRDRRFLVENGKVTRYVR